MKRVTVYIAVEVTDEGMLFAYCRRCAKRWGYDGAWRPTVAEGVAEAIVLNRVEPEAIGCRVTSKDARELV